LKRGGASGAFAFHKPRVKRAAAGKYGIDFTDKKEPRYYGGLSSQLPPQAAYGFCAN